MKFLAKIKDNTALKVAAASVASSVVAGAGMISVFATDPETSGSSADFTSALSTAFGNMQSDIFSYILIVLPIALAVVGAFFGIKKAISFFKSTAGR